MRIASIGGGPAGLYAAILLKAADPRHEVTVYERNRPDDTFGFGVVFSDATLGAFAAADATSFDAIRARFARWDDLDIHYGGTVVTSHGHGFAGMGRRALLEVLRQRAESLGVVTRFSTELGKDDVERMSWEYDVVIAADGVNSLVRRDLDFGARIDVRPNRFVWLGTTFPFRAFTFYFKRDAAGLFRVHAYRYAPDQSTFIVECTDETWRKTGIAETDEAATVAYCQRLFADELQGHALLANRSHWRQFPTVRCEQWARGNVVLVGDAAHTAHFSIGSGTKLAMEGAIALAQALLREPNVPAALAAYEATHRKTAEKLQTAAQVSLRWFEETERYFERLMPLPFAFNLLTRSLRISYDNLRERDPALVQRLDREFSEAAARAVGASAPVPVPRPLAAPLRIGDVVLRNRAVVGVAADGSVAADAGLVLLEAPSLDGDWPATLAALVARVSTARVGVSLPAGDATAIAAAARLAIDNGAAVLAVRSDDPQLARAARSAWPAPRPLIMSLADGDDAAQRARALKEAGADVVAVGAGRDYAAEARLAERARLEGGVPSLVTLAGAADANSVLGAGRADLCLLPG